LATALCKDVRPEPRTIGETFVACHHAEQQIDGTIASAVERKTLSRRLAVLEKAAQMAQTPSSQGDTTTARSAR
jgi:hypothetical protein